MGGKEKILRTIDKRSEEIIEFVRNLVKIRSDNPPGDESKVAKLLVEKMEKLRIENIKIMEKKEKRSNVLAHLYGTNEKPLLMFNAHIDTKPVGPYEKWRFDPYSAKIADNEMYGRGTIDNKSAAGAMVMAAGAIKEAGIRLNGSLLLAMTADEEMGTGVGVEWLIVKKGLRADAAIVGEPSGIKRSFDQLHIATRGIAIVDLFVRGKQVHSSMADMMEAVNASLKMANVLCRMDRELEFNYEPHPLCHQGVTLNLGCLIKGGLNQGIVPGMCFSRNDIRFPPGMTAEGVMNDLNKFLEKLREQDPQLNIKAKLKVCGEAAEISKNEPIVKSCIRSYKEVFGYEPELGCTPGVMESNKMINQGKFPAVSAFGPGLLYLAHGPNERVPVKDLINATKVYALTAMNYLGFSS